MGHLCSGGPGPAPPPLPADLAQGHESGQCLHPQGRSQRAPAGQNRRFGRGKAAQHENHPSHHHGRDPVLPLPGALPVSGLRRAVGRLVPWCSPVSMLHPEAPFRRRQPLLAHDQDHRWGVRSPFLQIPEHVPGQAGGTALNGRSATAAFLAKHSQPV